MCAPSIRAMHAAISLKEELNRAYWRQYDYIQEGKWRLYEAWGARKYRAWKRKTLEPLKDFDQVYLAIKAEIEKLDAAIAAHESSVAQSTTNGA